MIDVVLFKSGDSYYCYDIISGNLLEINDIQSEVLTNFGLGSKNIIKKLSSQYSTKDIIKNIYYIQKLIEQHVVEEKHDTANGIIFDYSNLISLNKIYYQERTDAVEKSYHTLQKRYFMDSMQLCEGKAEEQTSSFSSDKPSIECSNEQVTSSLLNDLEYFLGTWEKKCVCDFDQDWLEAFTHKLVEMQDALLQVIKEMQKSEVMKKLPTLTKYIKCILTREKLQFPCKAGLESLYIEPDGKVFICEDGLEVKDFEKSSYVSLLTSVYEEQPCCDCFARFLCGGYCKEKKNLMSDSRCKVFQETFLVLLKCCAGLLEENKEYEQFLHNLE